MIEERCTMERKKKHIMAIGAHIGDAELTCGKTLAKHHLMGDDITTVAVTAGEKGCPPTMDIHTFEKMNIESAHTFAEMMGGKFYLVGYKDGIVPDDEELRFKLADIIRERKPDVILTHWTSSLHKDHRVVSKAVEDAIFYAAQSYIERENPPHFVSGPYYAENWEDRHGFEPYIFVDVTAGYDLWEEAIQKLWLSTNSPWFKYLEYYDALSRSRGALVHKKRAECFDISPYQKKIVKDSF